MPPLHATASPTHQHEGDRGGQVPEDKVDVESMESFPASDAPSVWISRTS